VKARPVVGLLAALAVAAGLAAGGGAAPSGLLHPCDATSGVLCGTVAVPLDPGGSRTVPLHVEELPPDGKPAGAPTRVVFLIAGGPGQGSAQAFELRAAASFWHALFPGFTLVAFDNRGTGSSQPISCPNLTVENLSSPKLVAHAVGTCGRRLGARSSLYSSRSNAADVESVRRAIGASRITLFGVSYGTKQALAYALRYPSHVERLVLDSVVPTSWPAPFGEDFLQALPHGLDELCRNACRGVTTNAGRDFAELANQLAAAPADASLPRPTGKPVHVHLDGLALVQLGVDTDLNPGIAAELPAAVQAGLAGRLLPLERLYALDQSSESTLGISMADYVAVSCADGRFPWPAASSPAVRPPLLAKAVAALPPGALGPFGPWATAAGAELQCEQWPAVTADTALPAGPYPDVPVLILSGGRDIRTPTNEARSVAAKFRHARVVVFGGAGHAVTDQSVCAIRLVAAFTQGRPHGSCPRVPLEAAPLGPFPAAPAAELDPRQTLSLVTVTLRELEAFHLAAEGLDSGFDGLAGGSLLNSRGSIYVERYADVAGVTVTGHLSHDPSGDWTGDLYVGGSDAAPGVVTLRDGRLAGTLGDTRVSAPVSA